MRPWRRRPRPPRSHRPIFSGLLASAYHYPCAPPNPLLGGAHGLTPEAWPAVPRSAPSHPNTGGGPQLTRATPSSVSSLRDGPCGSQVTFTSPWTSDMNRRSPSASHRTIGYTQSTAGFEVGVCASDRLGNEPLLGPALIGDERAEEDIHPSVDDEWIAILRCGLADCPEPLRMLVGIAHVSGGVVRVLQVAACGSQAPQRRDQLRGLQPVAGLGVDRHGHVYAPCDPRGGSEHLLGRRALLVLIAKRRSYGPTGGRDHGKPRRNHSSRSTDIPGVRQYEGGATAMQRAQLFAAAFEVRCVCQAVMTGNVPPPSRAAPVRSGL